MNVEEALLRAFIAPARRTHYVARLATPKTREKLLQRLPSSARPRPSIRSRIEPSLQRADSIHDELRRRGAPERCYVMSASSDFDGQDAELRQALEEIVGYCAGTFLSCLPGRLGYFEGEEPNERYILERPAR